MPNHDRAPPVNVGTNCPTSVYIVYTFGYTSLWMDFVWDSNKDEWPRAERFISFEEIAAMIQAHEFNAIIDNPARPEQHCFIMPIHDYTWVVPFIFDEQDRIVLKTAYPSRKFHREYGGNRK